MTVKLTTLPDNGREEHFNEIYYLMFVLETVAVVMDHPYLCPNRRQLDTCRSFGRNMWTNACSGLLPSILRGGEASEGCAVPGKFAHRERRRMQVGHGIGPVVS